LCRLLGSGHHDLVLENLALRQQSAIHKRKTTTPATDAAGPLVSI
jgi:hypothetical protein